MEVLAVWVCGGVAATGALWIIAGLDDLAEAQRHQRGRELLFYREATGRNLLIDEDRASDWRETFVGSVDEFIAAGGLSDRA